MVPHPPEGSNDFRAGYIGEFFIDEEEIGADLGTRGQYISPKSHPLDLDAVLYSESAWAAGTLAVCFLSFFLLTGNLWSAIAFVLVASILIVPILVVWAGLGYYYVRKPKRK